MPSPVPDDPPQPMFIPHGQSATRVLFSIESYHHQQNFFMTTPPESPREATLKSRVIWSFWLLILLIGLPTWWTTTSIYRANLPTDLMLESHDDLWYSIPLCMQSSLLTLPDLTDIARKVQESAKGSQGLVKFHIQVAQQCSTEHDATIVSFEPGDIHNFEFSTSTSRFEARYAKGDLSNAAPYLAMFLQTAFLEEHASIAYLLYTNGKSSDKIQAFLQNLPQEVATRIQQSANRAFKPSSEYHLTFSLFTAGPAPSGWSVRPLLAKYIQPILYAISSTSNISVASQVQLYSSFSPSIQPQQVENGWQLRREDLTSFVNNAEWPLSPSIGTGPTVNFITYIPTPYQIPLLLENSATNAWLIPQWGGITILNPNVVLQEETELGKKILLPHLDQEILEPAFVNFQSQLLQLLGVPHSDKLPLQERLKSFQRLSGLSLYLRTASNLSSLARLAQHLSSIPIPRHVQHYVEHAIGRLSDFRECLSQSSPTTWSSGLRSVREAFADSEKAFFDKSMVGQVYFPDEHKVAVYLPLLGPIGVPLVVGLIREVKALTAKLKK